MKLAPNKQINAVVVDAVKRGWSFDPNGAGKASLRNGGHRTLVATTPTNAEHSARSLQRDIHKCETGRCQHGNPPAETIQPKDKTMSKTKTPPRLASARKHSSGRVLVRIVTDRNGKQTPYDLLLDPRTDSNVWTGHLWIGDEPTPTDALADLDKGEVIVGNLTFSGLPLHEVKSLASAPKPAPTKRVDAGAAAYYTLAEAADVLGVTGQMIRQHVIRGRLPEGVKRVMPTKGGKLVKQLTWEKPVVEAFKATYRKGASGPKPKPVAPVEVKREVATLPAMPVATPAWNASPPPTDAGMTAPAAKGPIEDIAFKLRFAREWGRLEGLVQDEEQIDTVAALLIQVGLLEGDA